MREEDIAKLFIEYFTLSNNGIDIYKEVKTPVGNIIDFVFKKDNNIHAFEVKTTANVGVLRQAFENKQRVANYSSICIPAHKGRTSSDREFYYFLCAHFGIGVYVLKRNGSIVKIRDPKLTVPPQSYELKLYDEQLDQIAGTKAGNVISDFKRSVKKLKERLLIYEDGIRLSKVIKEIDHHWGTDKSATACIRDYIKRKIIKGIVYDSPDVYLTEFADV